MSWRSRVLLLAALWLGLAGCARLVRGVGDDLAAGIRNHDDPQTVAEALPAYLVLLDGLLLSRPQQLPLLRAAAELNAAYAGSFVDDLERRQRLARRAFDYARRASCLELAGLCERIDGPIDRFQSAVAALGAERIEAMFGLAAAWAGYIQAHSDDWAAIAALPKAQALLARVVELQPAHRDGMPQVYLGVLQCLRPEALGGTPELGRQSFEAAIALSGGRNLMAKTLQAEYYARLLFDRELHDRLLNEVLSASAPAPGLTLSNVLAQQRAQHLRSTADDYF